MTSNLTENQFLLRKTFQVRVGIDCAARSISRKPNATHFWKSLRTPGLVLAAINSMLIVYGVVRVWAWRCSVTKNKHSVYNNASN